MPTKRIPQAIIVCLTALFVHLALSATGFAQAWVPEKGEGSVSVTYQKTDVRYHYDSTGAKEDKGQIHTHATLMALEYGLTDKLALDFGLAYIASKWDHPQGPLFLRPHGPLDNGSFHPMFQDAHLGLRYNVARRRLVVTPFIGFTIPTHAYEVRGHSAVGLGFKEFLVGVNVGRRLGPLLPNGYVQVRYSFAMHKRFAGLNLNRSNVDWEVGWFAKRSIALRFIGSWQRTHGGLSFSPNVKLTPDEFDIHDRVARANYLQLGGGVTFSVNRYVDIHAAYAPTAVYARDTHGDAGIVIGFSWRFSRGPRDRIAANPSSSKPPTVGQGMF
jgi:hypothetical protein